MSKLGAKWEPRSPACWRPPRVYQLDRANTRVANPDGSGTFPLLSGEQRTRGIEIGLERNISDPTGRFRPVTPGRKPK